MKRHTQVSGIRKWSANDMLELQSETLKVLDSFLSQYGDTIVSGCKVTANSISAGLVCVDGLVMPFSGVTEVDSFPIYLVKSETYEQREYVDNVVKNIAVCYSAVVSTSQPTSGGYITIAAEGNLNFMDTIQSTIKTFVNTKIGNIDAVLDSIISTQETI